MPASGASWPPALVPPALLCVISVAALLIAEARGSTPGRWLAKPVASTAFVWAALAAGALESAYGRLVLVALCLCWAGDLLLIPRQRRACFQAGIGAFLLGHVAYATAFVTRPWQGGVLVAALFAMAVFGWCVWRWLRLRVPTDLVGPVGAYIVTICAMAACGITATAGGGPAAIAAGALAFVASDLSVARDRFIAPGLVNVAWGLPLYYAAQLALASTV